MNTPRIESVEERAELVDDLDQRSHLGEVDGDEARDEPPEARQDLRHQQRLALARIRPQMPLVDVDRRGRGERVQLRRDAGHRRREDRGDHQADEADRHEPDDERREHVVHVAVVASAADLFDELGRAGPHAAHGGIRLDEGRARLRLGRAGGRGGCERRLAPRFERGVVLALERRVLAGPRARRHLVREPRVEEHRTAVEQEEREHEHAREQDEELQRDLRERADDQRVPALGERLRREIPLHLALVAAEIRERQEEAAEQARPERVRLVQIEPEVDGLETSHRTRDVQRRSRADALGQPHEQQHHRHAEPPDDEHHLLDVGPRDRLDAAEHRVDDRRHADRQHREPELPAQDHRQNQARRRDDEPAPEAALREEQQRRQRPRLRVEPPFEVLVGRVDARAVEEADERQRQDHHRDRQAEVDLDEPHAVGVRLAGRADHGDGAELRGHHRQTDGPPRQASAAEEIALDLVRALAQPQSVPDDPDQVRRDDGPVDPVHRRYEKCRPTQYSPAITSASTMTTST